MRLPLLAAALLLGAAARAAAPASDDRAAKAAAAGLAFPAGWSLVFPGGNVTAVAPDRKASLSSNRALNGVGAKDAAAWYESDRRAAGGQFQDYRETRRTPGRVRGLPSLRVEFSYVDLFTKKPRHGWRVIVLKGGQVREAVYMAEKDVPAAEESAAEAALRTFDPRFTKR